MNIGEFCIQKKTITLTLAALAAVVGVVSFERLPRLEDPEFTIKDAQVVTLYPGASPAEVEAEVSDRIEKAAQQLGQLKRVESQSTRGMSIVTVTIKDKYDKATLPQVWDELRRKIGDIQSQLPPGCQPTLVNDDFGDVYGVYLAITGDGYDQAELKEYAKFLQRELLLVRDVKKIVLFGEQAEAVYVEMSRDKMSRLGVSPQDIYGALAAKNLVASGGNVLVGGEYLPIAPVGGITGLDQFGELLISKTPERLVHLKDVAKIVRGYSEPPNCLLRFDGKSAVGLAISTVQGGNVVVMGEELRRRLAELESRRPVGMELGSISFQSESVTRSIDGFVVNLLEAVLIVVVVLLIFMGLRCGLIIGAVLFLTICATFIVMDFYQITLERISLGALIIALGMLVDNAIVVTEGMLVKIQEGEDRLKAARDVVAQQLAPLAGATAIAIIAFAAIGLSQDSSGEYCRSLFHVLLISLGLSWVAAVTVTPLLCALFLKAGAPRAGGGSAYDSAIFRRYRGFLDLCLRRRWTTCLIMGGMLAASVYGFGFIERSFFPSSTRPQFMVDLWMPEGTHIKNTEAQVEILEKFVAKRKHVTAVTSFVGQGGARFLLTYAPEKPNSAYAQLLVSVDDWNAIDALSDELRDKLPPLCPDGMVVVKKFLLGPGGGGKIQLRFSGPDPAALRRLADQAMDIMRADPNTMGVRSDWRQQVKTVRPILAEAQANRAGITYTDLGKTLQEGFEGVTIGVFRERDELLPIVARATEAERRDVKNIDHLHIWSPAAGKMIPIRQVVVRCETVWENPALVRRDRLPTVTVHCDQKLGNASALFEQLRPRLEGIPLPPGTTRKWGGEYEDSRNAQAALASSVPAFLVLMALITLFLFNAYRQTLIIWLCVPLALIGVTVGLLTSNQPFGFMALLGFLSLSGMLIKNAIVLIDETDFQIRSGKERYVAVIEAAVSRMRPLAMAALTTVLGMLPLVTDAFFVSMAVTIMYGLTFAAVLTLVVVPVLYAIFFQIRPRLYCQTE